jgi:hypothetical protein
MRMLVIDMVLEHPVPLAVYIIVYLHICRTDLGHIPMGLGLWLPLLSSLEREHQEKLKIPKATTEWV